MKRLCLAALPLAAVCGTGEARPPIGFSTESLIQHRLAGETSVVEPGPRSPRWEEVAVIVTISPTGGVTAAERDPKRNIGGADPAPALAAARRWKFRPFRYRGEAVTVRGIVNIVYRAPPKWRDPTATLPPIDYSTLKIQLVRSACFFGGCPDYSVTIDGSGAVHFITGSQSLKGAKEAHRQFGPGGGILFPGEHRSRIDRATLDALIERFRAARFFGLEPEYPTSITDQATYVLKFETGGRSWTVTDHIGEIEGMPPVVTELEKAVDRAAGTARWITGDESSVASLKEEGFDFRSRKAAELTAYLGLAGTAPDALILALIDAGVSPEYPMVFDIDDPPAPLGESLLVGAIGRHRPALFAWLAGRGWLARLPRERLSQAFAEGGGGCDPAVTRALVAAGADPKAKIRSEERSGATALIAAVRPWGPCQGLDLKPIVEALIAAGADVNAANDAGETALYGVEEPDLQEQLLAAGARADVRDRKGNSPVFSSLNDRIVLGLLDAGADPKGRYDDGKTLREQARERDMPSVLAWLDARRIK
ncbi:MAG TPA: DUF6438 domain-containing protein [Allosphingosinicella sp.]|jgi:hypothetical protein